MQHFRSNPPSRQVPPRPALGSTKRGLHAAIIRYVPRHGVAESTFGQPALNDPAFVAKLRDEDYQPTERTTNRVLAFIAEANHA